MLALAITAGLTSGCSAAPDQSRSEREAHALEDRSRGRTYVRHHYRCEDGRTLWVVFRDGGLSMDISGDAVPGPVTLTAPAQGRSFSGDDFRAEVKKGRVHLQEVDQQERVCIKQDLD